MCTDKEITNLKHIKKSEQLIKELRKCNAEKISSMMKLSDDLTQLNIKRYKNFKTPFNLDNAKQAMFAFKGDTYVGLDAILFQRKRLIMLKNIFVFSRLYGLVSPLDLIQPYRLEMGTNFHVVKVRIFMSFG